LSCGRLLKALTTRVNSMGRRTSQPAKAVSLESGWPRRIRHLQAGPGVCPGLRSISPESVLPSRTIMDDAPGWNTV